MSPQLDADGVPNRCLSFTVSGPWGHFKRVGRSVTKQTYQVPPRTTIAGMLAAIIGRPRDSYYDVFEGHNSAVAITPLSELRTINIPTVGVGTDPKQDVTETAGSYYSEYNVTYQDTTQDRQLHAYEVLADPAYRIDVAVEDSRFYESLQEHLEAGTSVYPPSLGKSEYLATITEIEAGQEPRQIRAGGTVDVDSVVPGSLAETVPQGGVTYGVERSPAVMEQVGGGRRTTRFDDYVYTRQPDAAVRINADDHRTPVKIGDRTVIFR